MNEVSIIINGVRYDAVKVEEPNHDCKECELPITICDSCGCLIDLDCVFKKSDKKFER